MVPRLRRSLLLLGLAYGSLLPMKASVRARTADTPFASLITVTVTTNDACAQGACASPCKCEAELFISCNGLQDRKCRCPALR